MDEDEQWFAGRVGFDQEGTPIDESFCAHAILGAEILEVADTLLDERFAENRLVRGPPCVRFYAGAPVLTPGGHRLGTVCALDSEVGSLTPAQREGLELVAVQVSRLLELLEVKVALEGEREELRRTLDLAAVAPWSFDAENAALVVNDAFYRIFATDAEREGGYRLTLARYLAEFVHPDDGSTSHRGLGAVVRPLGSGCTRWSIMSCAGTARCATWWAPTSRSVTPAARHTGSWARCTTSPSAWRPRPRSGVCTPSSRRRSRSRRRA